jgi:hypothetical protein
VCYSGRCQHENYMGDCTLPPIKTDCPEDYGSIGEDDTFKEDDIDADE